MTIEQKTRRITLRRTGLWSLIPRFGEEVNPEFYVFTGKLRVVVGLLLLVANATAALAIGRMQIDEDAYWRLMMVSMPLHVIDFVFAVWIWKGNLTIVGMRRLTYGCIVIEAGVTLLTMWVFGSVTSHMILFATVLILIYRIAFDFRIGVTVFLLIVLGHWAIVISEMSGWIPPQPLATDTLDGAYVVADRQLTSMIMITILDSLVFVVANWSVARLRHKELAIRMLRESLYSGEPGQVGRHTGRTLCDRYVVGRLLGTGGMGEVYEGQHRKTKRRVALKLLHPHLIEDETVLKRFHREAEITGRLGSEHIVEIVDVDDDDGQPFLALELIEGESLSARVADQGMLEISEVGEIVAQLARGLGVAHAADVVHRDLKPENVFLCRHADGRLLLKILDFGVSKLRGNATQITQEVAILGTPDFMSPEQAVGRVEEIEATADVFALGGIVYYTLTGRRPFMASSVPALLRSICDEEPIPASEFRESISADIEAVLAIAMAKKHTQRYQGANEFARDFAAAVDGDLAEAVRKRAKGVDRADPASRETTGDPSVKAGADTHLA